MEKENLYSPEALINLIIEGDLPISRIAKETNIPLPTLKNYIYGKTDASSMQYRMIKDLTDFFRNGQPLEVMIEENDCVMLSGSNNLISKFPHIEDVRIHTFKVLSELTYRYEMLLKNEDAKFEPFLFILTNEMLDFCECSLLFANSLIESVLRNCDKFNVKVITTEAILMSERRKNIRYDWFEEGNIQMFVKCSDKSGIQKIGKLDKIDNIKKHIFSNEFISNSALSYYCYYVILGNRIRTDYIIEAPFNLDPCLFNISVMGDKVESNFIKGDINNLCFDAVTSKYDFITAVTFSDYENLFDNKHPYFMESQFSGEVQKYTFSVLNNFNNSRLIEPRFTCGVNEYDMKEMDNFENSLSNVRVRRIPDLVTDIKQPIRPNYFNIKKFIIDKNIDVTCDIIINVTFNLTDKTVSVNFKGEDTTVRTFIHSIEYTTLDGEQCIYKF